MHFFIIAYSTVYYIMYLFRIQLLVHVFTFYGRIQTTCWRYAHKAITYYFETGQLQKYISNIDTVAFSKFSFICNLVG